MFWDFPRELQFFIDFSVIFKISILLFRILTVEKAKTMVYSNQVSYGLVLQNWKVSPLEKKWKNEQFWWNLDGYGLTFQICETSAIFFFLNF